MKCRGRSSKYKKPYQENCRGQVDQSFFDHHQCCTRCFKIKPKIDYGECNRRTLSDEAKLYTWHKTCKSCRDGDKRREARVSKNRITIEPYETKQTS